MLTLINIYFIFLPQKLEYTFFLDTRYLSCIREITIQCSKFISALCFHVFRLQLLLTVVTGPRSFSAPRPTWILSAAIPRRCAYYPRGNVMEPMIAAMGRMNKIVPQVTRYFNTCHHTALFHPSSLSKFPYPCKSISFHRLIFSQISTCRLGFS